MPEPIPDSGFIGFTRVLWPEPLVRPDEYEPDGVPPLAANSPEKPFCPEFVPPFWSVSIVMFFVNWFPDESLYKMTRGTDFRFCGTVISKLEKSPDVIVPMTYFWFGFPPSPAALSRATTTP